MKAAFRKGEDVFLREGVVNGEALVSHRFPLTDIAAAVATAAFDPGAVKVVVTPLPGASACSRHCGSSSRTGRRISRYGSS